MNGSLPWEFLLHSSCFCTSRALSCFSYGRILPVRPHPPFYLPVAVDYIPSNHSQDELFLLSSLPSVLSQQLGKQLIQKLGTKKKGHRCDTLTTRSSGISNGFAEGMWKCRELQDRKGQESCKQRLVSHSGGNLGN